MPIARLTLRRSFWRGADAAGLRAGGYLPGARGRRRCAGRDWGLEIGINCISQSLVPIAMAVAKTGARGSVTLAHSFFWRLWYGTAVPQPPERIIWGGEASPNPA